MKKAKALRGITAAVLIFVFGCSLPAYAQSTLMLEIARAGLYGTVGADFGTTAYGMRKDARTEANPLLLNNPALIGVALATSAIGLDASTRMLWAHGHHRLAVGLLVGVSAVHAFAVYRNLQ